MIVVAYGKMIPTKFLNIKNINLLIFTHHYFQSGGAAPIQRAIMNQDNETGIFNENNLRVGCRTRNDEIENKYFKKLILKS